MKPVRFGVTYLAAASALALALAAGAARAESLMDTVARLKPGVVAVGTFERSRSPPFLFRGTGFAVGDGTLIATAAHVVLETLQTEGRETMAILYHAPGGKAPEGREAKTIAVDKTHDVALLRITGLSLPTLKLATSNTVREGQGVAFTGFPLGTSHGYFPVTHVGIIGALVPAVMPTNSAARLDPKVIQSLKSDPFVLYQLDSTTFPGHSGSPLYDGATGEVVAIVNMGFLKSIKDSAVGQPSGISFAVPVQHLRELMQTVR